MLQHSKSLKSLRARTGEIYDKAKKKLSFTSRSERESKKSKNSPKTTSFSNGIHIIPHANAIYQVIEDYQDGQDGVLFTRGQKVKIIAPALSADYNVNVILLSSENFLVATHETNVQGTIPYKSLLLIQDEDTSKG
uniref:SH3 domain-containing protein n=1 Tax=Rhabditophanes sp. KR3021 TaxID=114890 RepID=A0AC35TTY2_9BILA